MKVQLLFEKHLNRGRKKKSFFLLGLLFLLGKTGWLKTLFMVI